MVLATRRGHLVVGRRLASVVLVVDVVLADRSGGE